METFWARECPKTKAKLAIVAYKNPIWLGYFFSAELRAEEMVFIVRLKVSIQGEIFCFYMRVILI